MLRLFLSVVLLCLITHPSVFAKESIHPCKKDCAVTKNKNRRLCKVNAFIRIVENRISNKADEGPKLSEDDIVSDAFIREVRPDTLNQPLMNWNQYKQAMDRYSDIFFDSFEVVTDRASVLRKRVILEAHSIADVKESAGGGTYGQDYILIFEFDKKGKITRLVEYADSLYSATFFKLIDCK